MESKLDENEATPPLPENNDHDNEEDIDMDSFFDKLERDADANAKSNTIANKETNEIHARKQERAARDALHQARDNLSKNITDYNCHLQVINAILNLPTLSHASLLNTSNNDRSGQTKSDIKSFHNACSKMYQRFPIPSSQWLAWIDFDIKYNCFERNDFLTIVNSFDKLLNDYKSDINVWLAYLNFVIDNQHFLTELNEINNNNNNTNSNSNNSNSNTKSKQKYNNNSKWKIIEPRQYIRNLFKRGRECVGYDFINGSLFWDKYREYETKVFSEIFNQETIDPEKTPPLDDIGNNNDADGFISNQTLKQIEILDKLWGNQLSIPHYGISDTYQSFLKWELELKEQNKGQYKNAYKTAKNFSEKLLKLEKRLNPSYFKDDSDYSNDENNANNESKKKNKKNKNKNKESLPNEIERIIAPGYVSDDRLNGWLQLLNAISNPGQNSGNKGKSKKQQQKLILTGISFQTVINYFERAINEAFLHEKIWLEYFNYLYLKGYDFSIMAVKVCKRGIRNLPNSMQILCNLLHSMEYANMNEQDVRNELLNKINYPYYNNRNNKRKHKQTHDDDDESDGLIGEILQSRRANDLRNYDLIQLNTFDEYVYVALQECGYYRRRAKCYIGESYQFPEIARKVRGNNSDGDVKENSSSNSNSNSNGNDNSGSGDIDTDSILKAEKCFERFFIMLDNNPATSYALTFYNRYTNFSLV